MPPYAESGSTVKFCMNKLWRKFEKNPSVTCGASSPTGAPVYRRQQYQTVRLRLVGRCAHTPPLSFRPNKSGAHIASTLGEVDRLSYEVQQ